MSPPSLVCTAEHVTLLLGPAYSDTLNGPTSIYYSKSSLSSHLSDLSSSCAILVLAPLALSVFHPCCQQIGAIPQTVKSPCTSHSKSSWPKTCGSPMSYRPTSGLEKTIVPRSTHLMLPLADCSSVWTSQEFWKDLGCI